MCWSVIKDTVMKNENSDEKVTSINPVNQSYRAHCMQLAEPLNKMS